jgi:hypothetical protein
VTSANNQGLPILCLDFDGCVHDYREGWKGGEIYGELVPGFWEWYERAVECFTVVIYSSRSQSEEGILAMKRWLAAKNNGAIPQGMRFASEKPPAFITIDDRCVRFDGNWNDPALAPPLLRKFKPWMGR